MVAAPKSGVTSVFLSPLVSDILQASLHRRAKRILQAIVHGAKQLAPRALHFLGVAREDSRVGLFEDAFRLDVRRFETGDDDGSMRHCASRIHPRRTPSS